MHPEDREESELERENEALRRRVQELELRWEQTFERTSAVKLVIDPANGAIVQANQAARDFYGYSREEFETLKITDLNRLPPELVQRELEAARAEHRSYFEFKHRLKSGVVRDVQVYSGPAQHGERHLLHSIICDITDRTQLAEQLAHSQRMDALGRMAGGVAHDINNLLTALDMLSSLIRGDVTRGRPVDGHLTEIEALTRRGAGLTQQLLAYCRRQIMEPRLLDLAVVIPGLENLLRRLLRAETKMTVTIRDSPLLVVADATRLEQVFLNLVLNARDAMPTGGNIAFTAQRLELSAEQREALGVEWASAVHVAVSDDGVGMDAETLRHAFDPFFTTKLPGEGTGLGLSTAFGIVEQSGGRMDVTSELGKGTKFEVYLPAAQERSLLPEPEELPEVGEGNETLLLVDDDADVRGALARVLEAHGYRVYQAEDSPSAMAQLQRHRAEIALIISDVVMPKESGPELIQRARARWPDLRVLYISGFLEFPNVGLGLKGVGEPLLAKPFPASRLVSKVREVLDAPARRYDDR